MIKRSWYHLFQAAPGGDVERHITNLYAKIGVRSRAEATAFALRHQLLEC